MNPDTVLFSHKRVLDPDLSSQRTSKQLSDYQSCFSIRTGKFKRRRRKLPYYNEEEETSADKRSISALKAQVAYLQQLLQGSHASSLSTTARMCCPVEGCGSKSSKLYRLYAHIRLCNDIAHQIVASIINERHCVECSKCFHRPEGLVRHEKDFHHDVYVSRLDKISGVALQPPPLPHDTEGSSNISNCSASGTEDEANHSTGPESDDSRAVSGGVSYLIQADTSQPAQGFPTSKMADGVRGLQSSKKNWGDLVDKPNPSMVAHGFFNANSRYGQNGVLPISARGYVSDSNLFAITLKDSYPVQPQDFSRYSIRTGTAAESQWPATSEPRWDGFYNGEPAVSEPRRDGVYTGEFHTGEPAMSEPRWDGFYNGEPAVSEPRRDGVYTGEFHTGEPAMSEPRWDGFYNGEPAVSEPRRDGVYTGEFHTGEPAMSEPRWDGFYNGGPAMSEPRWDGFYNGKPAMSEPRRDGVYTGEFHTGEPALSEPRWDGFYVRI